MKGLLIKDLYTIRNVTKQFLLMAGIALVFSLLYTSAGLYLIALLSLMGISAVMGAFNYDESSSWDKYAASLPLPRRAIVNARYLFAILCTAIPIIYSVFCSVLSNLVHGSGNPGRNVLLNTGIALCISLLSLSVSLPIAFWLGPAKARIASTACYIVLFLLAFSAWTFWQPQVLRILQLPNFLQIAALAGAIFLVLLFVLSYFISVHAYKSKEI